jgi:hypothetical protein
MTCRRLFSWYSILLDHDLRLGYVAGINNGTADFLLRPNIVEKVKISNSEVVDLQEMTTKKIASMDVSIVEQIINIHCEARWAHPGSRKLKFICKQYYKISISEQQMAKIIQVCKRCQLYKHTTKNTRTPYRIITAEIDSDH